MISANNITLRVGKKALFEDVNIKFTDKGRYRDHTGTEAFLPAAGSLQV